MPNVKKIYVSKKDEIAKVVEQLIDTDADEIVLSIPKFSRLAESKANFHLLKRESEVLKRSIVVESVDDKVLKLCEAEKLECVNPFFRKVSHQVDAASKHEVKEKASGSHEKEEQSAHHEIQTGNALPVKKEKMLMKVASRVGRVRLPKKKGRALVGILVVLILGGFLVGNAFKKAEITITRATTEWDFGDPIVIDKSISAVDIGGIRIPGQVFSQSKNFAMSFPASGKGEIERKAKGTIKIYNAFNTSPQALVVRTRFLTPDGKLFRLTEGVTVPAAKKEDGKIIPTFIEAEVAADKPGEEFNIGPVAKFTIPGFKGSPRHEGFYGESSDAMIGGFIGETAYPTDEDIENAKELAAKTLENTISTLVAGQMSQEFVVLESAKNFTVKKQTVDPEVNEDDQFSVFTEGELSLVAFRESDLRELLLSQMRIQVGQEFEIKEDNLAYNEEKVELQGDHLVISPSYESIVARAVDLVSLRKNISGKSEDELRKFIFSIPGLVSAKISLWPFWVRTVPEPAQIEVMVD